MLTSLSTEDLIPADHPIRRIRRVVDEVLVELDGEFDAMYSRIGRPQRAARAVVEGDGADGAVLDALASGPSASGSTTTCCSSGSSTCRSTPRRSTRRRSPRTASGCWSTRSPTGSSPRWSARRKLRRYVSSEHFSVDGTLLEAWASHKSFKPKDGPPPIGPPAGRNVEVRLAGPEALATTPTPRRPTPRRGCTARATTPRRRCATRAPADGEPQRA